MERCGCEKKGQQDWGLTLRGICWRRDGWGSGGGVGIALPVKAAEYQRQRERKGIASVSVPAPLPLLHKLFFLHRLSSLACTLLALLLLWHVFPTPHSISAHGISHNQA